MSRRMDSLTARVSFPAVGRATSVSRAGSKQLVYNGQLVNVILPAEEPECVIAIDELVTRIESIQERDPGEVASFQIMLK
jgi:hypothetical protein